MVPINNSVLIRRQGVARFDAQHAIVQPETVIKWYRQGFKLYWRWKSRAGKRGRPCILGEIRDLRGRDGIYGNCFKARVKSMGIDEVVIAPRSPWQNPYCERVIGWIGLTAPPYGGVGVRAESKPGNIPQFFGLTAASSVGPTQTVLL